MMRVRGSVHRGHSTIEVAAQATPKAVTVKGRSTQNGRSTTSGGRASGKGSSQSSTLAEKTAAASSASSAKAGRRYINITGFPFPLGPVFERSTIRIEVVKDTIWTFEQTQAIEAFNVYTPVRMTVIRLASGGLWVHAPVAPTAECVRLVKELGGEVEHIVLPTFAVEHKSFVGPFSRRFPKAKVYVTPFQWSFPINLPPQFFGIFPTGELLEGATLPWSDEIDHKLLLPPRIGASAAIRISEVAFFHRRSRTLLVTDAVIYIEDTPPACIPEDALVELGGRDGFLATFVPGGRSREEVAALARKGPALDTPANRALGWQRMSLLVLYFSPSDLLTPQANFAAVANRLLVAPVVSTLVYSKVPRAVCDWVDAICSDWRFERIIPCHFAAPVRAGPAEFKRAFAFAYALAGREAEEPPPAGGPLGLLGRLFGGGGGGGGQAASIPEADLKALNAINSLLLKVGAVVADAEASPP